MAMFCLAVLLSFITCCWTQTPTHYTMQDPTITVFENAGTVEVCILRTGNDINIGGIVFLTTEDDSASGGEDFDALEEYSFRFGPGEPERCLDIVITDDDNAEFKEGFKVTIVGASDGVSGSQPSTEITIEENDHCTEIPINLGNFGENIYVSPWKPVPEKAIVVKNTIAVMNDISLFFSSSHDNNFNSYHIDFDNSGNLRFSRFKNTVPNLISEISALDIFTGNDEDTVEVSFEQLTGTFTVTHSGAPSAPITLTDTDIMPLVVRHIFANVLDGDAIGESLTICNVDPIALPRTGADQLGTSQTYPNAVASQAIDDDHSSVVASGTCSVTENVEYPWWRADLGKEYEVSSVIIYPVEDPADNAVDEIDGAQVYIGSCKEADIDKNTLCGTIPNDYGSPVYIECASSNTYGRYVYIRLDTGDGVTKTLSLCEVQVYGSEVPFGRETTISFSSSSYETEEADTIIPVTIELSGPGATCSSVDVNTEDDTAKSSGTTPDEIDFSSIPKETPNTITFNPDATIQTVNITINSDMTCEKSESFDMILSNTETGVLGMPWETTVTITDNDSNRYSIEEATDGFEIQEGEPLEILIRREGSEEALRGEGRVLFISDIEGNEASETVNFEAKEASDEVTVVTFNDNVYEDDTTFTISLQATGECDTLVTGENMATVTLKDDDSRFCFDDDDLDNDVLVLPEDVGIYQIKLNRDGSARDKTVDISVENSVDGYHNAQHGEDFTLSSNSVDFVSGEDEAYVTLTIKNDYSKEEDESFDLILSDPEDISKNIKDPYRITIVIQNDDDIYRFEPKFYSVSEDEKSVDVCLQRYGALSKSTKIELEIQDVETNLGRDYAVSPAGIDVTFVDGKSEVCTSISILGDSVAEQTETFLVHIKTENVDKEYNTRATVSIQDSPSDVFISFSRDEYFANEDDVKITVYIIRSGNLYQPVSASITSSMVSADSNDYISVTDGIRIPSGTSVIPFEITIKNDNNDESDEQFKLTLSNPSGGIISGAETIVTIRDNDNQDDNDSLNGKQISGAVLAAILVAVVVVVVVTALGVALFCAYLLRSTSTQAEGPRQLQSLTYPEIYGNGNARKLQYRQEFYTRQPPNMYYS